MSARFKKSPISTRSFNRGFKILSKAFIEPALHVTSALVKTATQSASASSVRPSVSYPKTSEQISPIQPQTIPGSSVFDVRKKGLDQVTTITQLYYHSPRPSTVFDLEGVLSKYITMSNRYMEKAVTCGYDCYTFAESFFAQQIQSVKREKTRSDYQVALDVLPLFKLGKDGDEIISAIISALWQQDGVEQPQP